MTAPNPRIGYLGPPGTFTEQALRSQPDLVDNELVPLPTFVDVLASVNDGTLERGFVAVENAIEGTVNITLDTLAFDTDLSIQREVVLDIEMNLMALEGTALSGVTTVASHPVANAQCRAFVRKNLPDAAVRPASSTAEAAYIASTTPGVAALGPALAGEEYGLATLAGNVADHPGNQTRFILVAANGIPSPTGHDKTSVVVSQREDKPGSLVAILEEFAARSINLTKLTSRPAKTTLGTYRFITDIEGHIADDVVADCLRSIRAKHADVKFLGSYPAAGQGSTEVRATADAAWTEAGNWIDDLRQRIDGGR